MIVSEVFFLNASAQFFTAQRCCNKVRQKNGKLIFGILLAFSLKCML